MILCAFELRPAPVRKNSYDHYFENQRRHFDRGRNPVPNLPQRAHPERIPRERRGDLLRLAAVPRRALQGCGLHRLLEPSRALSLGAREDGAAHQHRPCARADRVPRSWLCCVCRGGRGRFGLIDGIRAGSQNTHPPAKTREGWGNQPERRECVDHYFRGRPSIRTNAVSSTNVSRRCF
jgi:hypothetical protein